MLRRPHDLLDRGELSSRELLAEPRPGSFLPSTFIETALPLGTELVRFRVKSTDRPRRGEAYGVQHVVDTRDRTMGPNRARARERRARSAQDGCALQGARRTTDAGSMLRGGDARAREGPCANHHGSLQPPAVPRKSRRSSDPIARPSSRYTHIDASARRRASPQHCEATRRRGLPCRRARSPL